MALRDYSNGQTPGLSNLINNINEQQAERDRAERENLETVGEIGLAFVIGTALTNLFQSRRSQQ